MADVRAGVGRAVERAVESIWRRLDAPDLEPALRRRGDLTLRDSALKLGQMLEDGALAQLDELRSELPAPDQLASYEAAVAYCAAAVAGLHLLGDGSTEAMLELKAAANLVRSGEIADLLREGTRAPESFLALLHAQWLMRSGDVAGGARVASALLRGEPGGELERCAREIVDTPQPLQSAPALFRINGCGVALFGRREPRSDGSYVATRYLCLLFIPIFPWDAFRVSRENRGYRFYGKVALDRTAHLLRRVVAGVALAAGVVGGSIAYLESDRHQLNVRVAEAARLETGGHDAQAAAQALARYEQIFHDYEDKVDASRLEPAALGFVRASTLVIGDTLTPAGVDVALGALRRFSSLPAGARGGEAAAFVLARTEKWVDSLGSADPERATGSLRLLGVANVALDDPSPLVLRERALYLKLGQQLQAKWPVVALEFFANAAEEKGAPAAMDQALAGLPPTALETLSPVLDEWIDDHQGMPAFAHSSALLQAVRTQADARAQEPGRAELLEKGSEAQLQSALATHAGDPAYSAALAERVQGSGDAARALTVLQRLGSAGQLPENAALLWGRLSSELRLPQEAQDIYEHWLLSRLPAYEATSFKLNRRVFAKRRELSDMADNDTLPTEIKTQLDAESDTDKARSLYSDWEDGQLDKDAEIKKLRERVERLDAVVPVALDLGMLLLETAQTAEGEARAQALSKAERTFLSIQSAGQGLPAYHLGLGAVYFRLGKTAESEREFQVLLARKEPKLELQVAHTYRDLGQRSQARALAQGVYEHGGDQTKNQAAVLMSLVADSLEDQEKWLLLADQTSDFVKTSLIEVQAHKAFRAGDLPAADEKFQRAYELYLNDQSGSGLNNAALALGSRYSCTGDVRHLTRAVELLEKARHRNPSDVVVLQNLAASLAHLGEIDALHLWLDMPALKLSTDEIDSVLGWLEGGESRATLLTALTQSPQVRQANEIIRQARLLGPSWPTPYYTELARLTAFEDAAGLAALEQQVNAAAKIDREQIKREREEWLSGANDARQREAIEGAIVRYKAVLLTLSGPNAAASRGVVRALWADQEDSLAALGLDLEHAQASLKLWRQAAADWPALSLEGEIASELARVAMYRALGQPNAEVRHGLRRDGLTLTLWHWLKTRDAASLAAVKAQPELAEGGRVLAAAPSRRQSELAFVLGSLTDDADLVRHARERLAQPDHIIAARIVATLGDGEEPRAHLDMTREMIGPPP